MNFHTRPGTPRARPRAMKPTATIAFFRSDDYDSRAGERRPAVSSEKRSNSKPDRSAFPVSRSIFFFFFFRMHLSRMRACACVFRVRVFRFTPECDFYAVNAFSFQHVKLQGAAVLESNGTLFPAVTSQCAVLHPFRSMHRCRASIIVRPIVAIGSIYPTADSG